MIRQVVTDPLFLSRKSEMATKDDFSVMTDLLDTLRANHDRCVGMAANMIGVHKRIIVFDAGPFCMGMYNPEIVAKEGPYVTSEGCLSLPGERKTTRFQTIEVRYLDQQFQPRQMKYSGWIAQIIQHEIDHCDGILI